MDHESTSMPEVKASGRTLERGNLEDGLITNFREHSKPSQAVKMIQQGSVWEGG